MKTTVLTAAIALALTTGISAPAQAGDARHDQWSELASLPPAQAAGGSFTTDPVRFLISLLLPAVQAAREAAR